VSPIHADFWVPQQALSQLKVGQSVRLRCDAYPGGSWVGQLTAINPEVDTATRNIRIRATFENADGRLRPGMFANVQVLAPEKRKVLVIPATAPIFAPYGDSVFTIEDGKGPDGKPARTVKQRAVRLGERRGDFVEVTSGLTAGETIASSGAFKLRNGMSVVENNALAPAAELSPTPAD
jgi:membrane fusion protein (multidrug efflux system)